MLLKKIDSYLLDWQKKISEDEWYFTKIREEIISNLQQEEAFNLIPDAIDIVLKQNDDFLCAEIFQIFLDIVKKADTTEKPPYLNDNWDKLINHVSSFGDYHKSKVEELKSWYRKHRKGDGCSCSVNR